ncbi:MAG: biotin-dependent carboxyltransferase family protein [Gracilimonas sp.]|uniref:5-oxoprolinase subunit C family protein n=1 Tax=Gracilimonas sp. TaxID=1974203 RepID=UPI001997329F|nr:biotin-dependent carboxyltransferase family protein [Gracilimonas sp.]MBD3615117.1 biotin-dependent carboxyltransferase family protein [Gracilimonas sp.]
MNGKLEVLDGGLITTVQDKGRFGYRNFGIPVSGVMDEHAYQLANRLVANPKDAPVLEFTVQGGTFRFHTQAVIGITGAEADIFVNDHASQTNRTIAVNVGDIVKISRVKAGCRIYMAIAGEWEIEKIMDSYSTCMPAGFGGFKGRKLKKGDVIFWKLSSEEIKTREVPKEFIPHYSTRQKIRIIAGPEWDWLTENQQLFFLETGFKISTQSNRMGIRLESEAKIQTEKREMKSAPVVPGIIQLPQDGNPIILMKDAQSVGGYPRIAKVIDADLWRLGQIWSGNEISFNLIGMKESLKLKKYYQELRRF